MEIELPTFTQFLHEGAILSQRQAEDLSNAMIKKDEDQKIFILSDFFRSLNASDCYDLSLRLYMYWKRTSSMTDSQQASLQRIPDVTPRKGMTMKSPKHNTSMTTSNSNIKNRVLSPDTSDCDVKGISRSNTHNSGIFDSLHKIAQHRETLRSENEKKKMENEMEGCTFHPKTNRSNLSRSSTDVFERLQRDLRKEKKDFNEAKKAQKEMRGCTFQPEVLNPHDSSDASNANLSRTFDRLYRESQRRKNNSIDYEIKKKELEVRGCTFTPAVMTRGDRGETSIDDGMARSEKLHKLHEERERKMLKKQIEKTMEESNKYSFKPQTYSSPTRRDDSKDVYERLLEWREQKNRKMEMKYKEKVTKEKEMSQERHLNSRKKDDNDVPKDQSSIHERLYQESTQQKAKKEKIVQDVLKDMGASFKPKTNVSRGSSVKGTKRQPLSLQFINVKEDKVEEDDKMPSQRENLPAPEQLSSGRRLFGSESKSLSQPTMNTEVRTATFGK